MQPHQRISRLIRLQQKVQFHSNECNKLVQCQGDLAKAIWHLREMERLLYEISECLGTEFGGSEPARGRRWSLFRRQDSRLITLRIMDVPPP